MLCGRDTVSAALSPLGEQAVHCADRPCTVLTAMTAAPSNRSMGEREGVVGVRADRLPRGHVSVGVKWRCREWNAR